MSKILEKHTRKELAWLLADLNARHDPSLRGSEKVIAKGLLKGAGALKPQTKTQLIKGINAFKDYKTFKER